MRRLLSSAVAALSLVVLGPTFFACRPELGDRESLVTRTRVLAVRGEPPEAKPGEVVAWTLLVASPNGPLATPIASWAFCATPKLLTENGAASAACLEGDRVRPLAEGAPAIEAAIPGDACALFGPQVTSADLRPRDPDITGGFYQPLRVTVFDRDEPALAFGLQRIRCALANAAADAYGQAAPDTPFATGVAKRYGEATTVRAFDGQPGRLTEMDALVAYLQILGRLTDAAHKPLASAGQ